MSGFDGATAMAPMDAVGTLSKIGVHVRPLFAVFQTPPPNAFELYRGLQDVGVPSKLVIYKGFEGVGHGPSKPKSSRAVMQHNLDWFDKYIFTESKTTAENR